MNLATDLNQSEFGDKLHSKITGLANIQQSIANIIRTRPGERLNRPVFGCDLEALLFASITAETARLIHSRITLAITAWEPRVVVLNRYSSVTPDLANNRYDAVVAFQIRALGDDIYSVKQTIGEST